MHTDRASAGYSAPLGRRHTPHQAAWRGRHTIERRPSGKVCQAICVCAIEPKSSAKNQVSWSAREVPPLHNDDDGWTRAQRIFGCLMKLNQILRQLVLRIVVLCLVQFLCIVYDRVWALCVHLQFGIVWALFFGAICVYFFASKLEYTSSKHYMSSARFNGYFP